MPVPGSQKIRRPLLEIFKDEKPHNFVINEFVDIAAEKLSVQTDELSQIEKAAFRKNVNDAVDYLLKSKLLSNPSKETYLITRTGLESLVGDTEDSEPVSEVESESEIPVGLDEAPEEISNTEEPELEIKKKLSKEPVHEKQKELPEETAQEHEEKTEENESESDDIFFDADNGIESESESKNNENESDDENLTMNENENEIENEIGQELPETTEEVNEIEETEPDITGLENGEEEIEDEANEAGKAGETETKSEEIAGEPDQNLSQNLSIEEMLEKYNETLAGNVAERIEALNQDNFCMLVMDLLSKMGYRAFQNARYTNEAEGSNLIQGIILENKAGMNPIYIHARKLSRTKTVSKSEMLDFVNAISDKGGKGMFITVGKFSNSAEDAAKDEGIMLVDGEKLAGLMISNNFCVSTERTFEVKALDDESFSEYEN